MKLVRSNRTEELADALTGQVQGQPLGPFDAETIVVQSRGMERWLTLTLAERLGVWSNPSFPFPRTAIEMVLEDLGRGASPESRAYEPSALKWTLARLLEDEPPDELEAYLGGSERSDRALKLGTSLASVFDRYVVTRPRMLEAWVRGQDSKWQAKLWRQVTTTLGSNDLASRIEAAIPLIDDAARADQIRFQRLHLFSLETLPPLFLRLFGALSRSIPTSLYLLTPTTEYVSNVNDAGQFSLEIDSAVQEGHSLLISLGGLARDFQELLLEADACITEEEDRFATPERASLLETIQADILAFRNPLALDERTDIARDDASISVHACTSPMREVMVLHDVVRAALEQDSTLRPEDIVVMTPDLESYAPAFRAVFGGAGPRPIPFEVHDRRTREDAAFYDDFLTVLEVLESRFTVLDIVRLMDAQSWRHEFRFSPAERVRIGELLEKSGIRWGIDEQHREALGFPPEALHTWRAGFGRLFLGFAAPPGEVEVFAGLLPRGDANLADAELLARVARLCTALFDFKDRMKGRASVSDWTSSLGDLISVLVEEEDDTSGAVRTLRGALQRLEDFAHTHQHRSPVRLDAVRDELRALVRSGTPAAGFLRRGVTLSELVPLRSIPFRMVCLLGMSEEAFPRPDDRPSFDVTTQHHRLGDRNKRLDDRHSFLQTILCARDRLVITYSAPSSSTRTNPTPSPPVAELLETASQYARRERTDETLPVVEHPLHAFDGAYFRQDSPLTSYSERHLEIAKALQRPAVEAPRVELLAEDAEPALTLSIGELAQWLWHPTRQFIQTQLRTRFDEATMYEPTRALTELGKLEAFRVGNEAIEKGLRGKGLREFLNACSEFPEGSWGQSERAALAREVEALASASSQRETEARLLEVRVGDVRIEGRLDGLGPTSRVKTRFNRAGTKTELTTWLEHLLLQTADAPQLPKTTELFLRASEGSPDRVTLRPVENAAAILESLVGLYEQSQRQPVSLLNRPSWTYASMSLEGKDGALETAKRQQENERWDRYARFAWGRRGPFVDSGWTEAFCRTALEVYQPLFEHRSLG